MSEKARGSKDVGIHCDRLLRRVDFGERPLSHEGRGGFTNLFSKAPSPLVGEGWGEGEEGLTDWQ
jgi:hypothetical protein